MKSIIKALFIGFFMLTLTGCVTKTVIVKEYIPFTLDKNLTALVSPTPPPGKAELGWIPELSREANLERQVAALKKYVFVQHGDLGICNGRLETIEKANEKLVLKANELNLERLKK